VIFAHQELKKPFNKSLRPVSLSLDKLFFVSVGHKLELLATGF